MGRKLGLLVSANPFIILIWTLQTLTQKKVRGSQSEKTGPWTNCRKALAKPWDLVVSRRHIGFYFCLLCSSLLVHLVGWWFSTSRSLLPVKEKSHTPRRLPALSLIINSRTRKQHAATWRPNRIMGRTAGSVRLSLYTRRFSVGWFLLNYSASRQVEDKLTWPREWDLTWGRS